MLFPLTFSHLKPVPSLSLSAVGAGRLNLAVCWGGRGQGLCGPAACAGGREASVLDRGQGLGSSGRGRRTGVWSPWPRTESRVVGAPVEAEAGRWHSGLGVREALGV